MRPLDADARRERRPPRVAVILLVEDEAGDQELTRRALLDGKIEKELYVAKDGEEALDYLLRRGRYADGKRWPLPDLILLDLNLPRLDGRQFLARVKAEPRLRRIPVVVLTTSRQDKDVVQSYEAGASSYIVKPTTVDQSLKLAQALETYWFEAVRLPPLED
ncbi:MAG: two-component system response regulator [Rhodocyclales bacterium GWA2_65_20]|nr:MAG: two-component system response regulator [Rhodocyclales bacterium GWA2_65_20]